MQMGEHTEWMKYNNFEISHKAPMMLHVPGLIEEVLECSLLLSVFIYVPQSEFSSSLVEFVDILPTLVEAAGLPQLDLCPEYSRNISICRCSKLALVSTS